MYFGKYFSTNHLSNNFHSLQQFWSIRNFNALQFQYFSKPVNFYIIFHVLGVTGIISVIR